MNKKRMQYLIETLNHAADVYYNTGEEVMPNFEYDALYDELEDLETETGIILPDSPTQRAGIDVNGANLPKVMHEYPALSLAKTKDVSLFPKTFSFGQSVLMWKEDGGTLIATYDDGKLTTLATRGNGRVGQNITYNAKYIHGLPLELPFASHFVVRGEALMSYKEFERVNAELPDDVIPYKNPRNLANSTVSLEAKKKVEGREIWFHAFKLVHVEEDYGKERSFFNDMEFLKSIGFETTEHILCNASNLEAKIQEMTDKVSDYEFPVDGLVVASNDVEYAESQPGNGHNPNKLVGFALKWEDETVETTLRNIEWSASRTGLLNPVAVFDPVELEGTTVSRASVHNVSIIRKLRLRIGDTVSVYKANKIIPQIAENASVAGVLSDDEALPKECPCCHGPVHAVVTSNQKVDVEVAMCENPDCAAKHIGKFTHFVERDCMNILGLSKATLTYFIDRGWIQHFADIYNLDRYKEEIVNAKGFGKKSYKNMIDAIEKSRKTSFIPLIHALGIPNIGEGQAKLFAKEYAGNLDKFLDDVFACKDFSHIVGIGQVLNKSLIAWGKEYLAYKSPDAEVTNTEIKDLLAELTVEIPEQKAPAEDAVSLAGKIFVITGDVYHFKNRNELKAKIESLGGRVSGSVSSKTTYLINNDTESTSSKNQKAKMLGIPIISEDEFLEMLQN